VLVAGGSSGADGVPAAKARLIAPFGMDFDKAGTIFMVELTGERARRVDRRGILSVIAGTIHKGAVGEPGAVQ
jgi:hypothetical protein